MSRTSVGGPNDATVRRAARFGLAARGVMYLVVALLVGQLALGDGGGSADQQGAMRTLASQPFGRFWLALVACGLLGYALWRAAQAVRGHDTGGDLPAWAERVGAAVRSVIYLGLSALAWRTVLQGGGGGADEESVTAWALDAPAGRVLVGVVGVVIVLVGLRELKEARTAGFLDRLDLSSLSSSGRRNVERAGRGGHGARGVVFAISGGFVVRAAIVGTPETGVGLDGALQEVLDAPGGPVLLGAIAFGLLLFGALCLVEARFVDPRTTG
ncbi:DUF1206 domain-containing protein [Nitriliruptoraceae bacterium ZYF776]|nr:DUF1206 domain-containing protein [Profundirhabdus halotolerans]